MLAGLWVLAHVLKENTTVPLQGKLSRCFNNLVHQESRLVIESCTSSHYFTRLDLRGAFIAQQANILRLVRLNLKNRFSFFPEAFVL